MQKVITPDAVDRLCSDIEDGVVISGCVAKAEDVAVFTNSVEETYKNLRLDYANSAFKDVVENNGDMYVVRFTTNDYISNSNYPKMDGSEKWNSPPCTGNGYTGSAEHLIPEFSCKDNNISDGAIYKINSNGEERLLAFWNSRDECFELLEE